MATHQRKAAASPPAAATQTERAPERMQPRRAEVLGQPDRTQPMEPLSDEGVLATILNDYLHVFPSRLGGWEPVHGIDGLQATIDETIMRLCINGGYQPPSARLLPGVRAMIQVTRGTPAAMITDTPVPTTNTIPHEMIRTCLNHLQNHGIGKFAHSLPPVIWGHNSYPPPRTEGWKQGLRLLTPKECEGEIAKAADQLYAKRRPYDHPDSRPPPPPTDSIPRDRQVQSVRNQHPTSEHVRHRPADITAKDTHTAPGTHHNATEGRHKQGSASKKSKKERRHREAAPSSPSLCTLPSSKHKDEPPHRRSKKQHRTRSRSRSQQTRTDSLIVHTGRSPKRTQHGLGNQPRSGTVPPAAGPHATWNYSFLRNTQGRPISEHGTEPRRVTNARSDQQAGREQHALVQKVRNTLEYRQVPPPAQQAPSPHRSSAKKHPHMQRAASPHPIGQERALQKRRSYSSSDSSRSNSTE